MRKSCCVLALTGLAVVSGSALAEEKETSAWKNEIELGFIRTTGNTETQTATLKADVTYEVEKWRHNARLEGFGTLTEDAAGNSAVSAERYELSVKSDYKFNEYDYIFGLLELKKDRFGGFEYENTVSAGYGRKVIKQKDMELDLEIGPGIRLFKVDNGVSDEESLVRLAAKYWWQISENAKLTQYISADIGEDITSMESVSGVQASINSKLALKFTYTLRHKSEVPAETEKTDTVLAMTLVYSY